VSSLVLICRAPPTLVPRAAATRGRMPGVLSIAGPDVTTGPWGDALS
jgi:hypothetical protein